MSLETVSDDEVGVDMVVEDFTVQRCKDGSVIVALFGDVGEGVRGGPFTIRIPKALGREIEVWL